MEMIGDFGVFFETASFIDIQNKKVLSLLPTIFREHLIDFKHLCFFNKNTDLHEASWLMRVCAIFVENALNPLSSKYESC